jgi:hypothetical protein
VRGSGRVGWDGSVKLAVKADRYPLPGIPSLRTLPVAIAGAVSGDVTLEGDHYSRMQLGGLVELLAFRVRETLFGDGTLKLVPGADAIAISGNLFGKVAVEGYLTLFPKLTLTATLKFHDMELERIFPEMRNFADVTGRADGEARIALDGQDGLTYGGLRLTRLEIVVAGNPEEGQARREVIRNRDDVLISTDGNVLRFDRANLISSLGDFFIRGKVSQKDSDVQLRGQINLALLEYFFRSAFERTRGKANLDLVVQGDLDRPRLRGWLDLRETRVVPRGLEHALQVPSGRLEFDGDELKLVNLSVLVDGALARASGHLTFADWVPARLEGRVTGELSARILQWLFREQVAEATGAIGVDVQVSGTWKNPDWSGTAAFKQVNAKLRSLQHQVSIDEGTLDFRKGDIIAGCVGAPRPGCRALHGRVDEDHPIAMSGRVSWSPAGLGRVEVQLEGSELTHAAETYRVTFSPELRIHGDGKHLVAEGKIDLVDGRYFQNFDLKDTVLVAKRTVEAPEPPFWVGTPLLESMELRVKARSSGSALAVKSNVADITMCADLEITGTLSEPRLDGSILIDAGGKFNPPAARIRDFVTDAGVVRFDPSKIIPSQTPELDLAAQATFIDAYDYAHTMYLKLRGTVERPQLILSSSDGWDQTTCLSVLLLGQTPDQIRRLATGGAGGARTGRGSASENVIKTVTGMGVGAQFADPIKDALRLDQVAFEFGAGSFDVRLCKNFGRYLKVCGNSEVGFGGQSRIDGTLQLRASDWVSLQGRGEYTTQRVDTSQDSLSRLRLELKFQIPLDRR